MRCGARGLVLAVLVAVGCGSPTEPQPSAVSVEVLDQHLFAGQSGRVHLVNGVASTWEVSPCPVALERLTAGGWRSLPMPACSVESVALDGGEPLEVELRVPAGAASGVYRAVYGSWMVIPGWPLQAIERVLVYSNRFAVPAIR